MEGDDLSGGALANGRAIAALPDLAAALKTLANEVAAATGIAEPEIRQAVGNTNYACLMRRAEEARAALAKAGFAP